MVGWDWCGFDQKRIRKRYAKLVFLHPVGSASHIMHFGGSGARSIDVLFFMLGWDRYGYDKKRVVTHYAVLVFSHPVGSACHICILVRLACQTSMQYFSYSGGPIQFP
jgi:hypothetical protein